MLSWGTGRHAPGSSRAQSTSIPLDNDLNNNASDSEKDEGMSRDAEGALLAGAAALAKRRHAIRIKRKSKINFRVLRLVYSITTMRVYNKEI